MRRFAPTAAGGETPETADAVADGESGGEEVGGSEHRQPLLTHVEPGEDQSQNESAEEYAGALQRRERKDLAGVGAKIGIERDHQQFGPQHSRQRAIDSQVDDLLAVEAALLREVRCHSESD